MPNGDGLSFAHAVEKSFPAVPVILVSGNLKSDEGFEFEEAVPSAALMSVVRRVFPSTVGTKLPD